METEESNIAIFELSLFTIQLVTSQSQITDHRQEELLCNRVVRLKHGNILVEGLAEIETQRASL